jgi:hypothetical protein
MIGEKALMAATASFFTQYVFGPDRATMLTAQLPADAQEEATRRAAQARRLDQQLAKNDTAQNALITELETPADPGDPAAAALRERIRGRYRELHGEQKTLEVQRDQLDAATTEVSDPALLDALPVLGDILTQAPAGLAEQLFEAFHLHAVYSKEHRQVTIRVTITDATPQAVARLLADTRVTLTKQQEHDFEETSSALSYSSHDQRGWGKLPLPPVAALGFTPPLHTNSDNSKKRERTPHGQSSETSPGTGGGLGSFGEAQVIGLRLAWWAWVSPAPAVPAGGWRHDEHGHEGGSAGGERGRQP